MYQTVLETIFNCASNFGLRLGFSITPRPCPLQVGIMPTGHPHPHTGDMNSSPRVCMASVLTTAHLSHTKGQEGVVKMGIRWQEGVAVTGDLSKDIMCVEREKKQGKGERGGGGKEKRGLRDREKLKWEGEREERIRNKEREREKRIEGGMWDAREKENKRGRLEIKEEKREKKEKIKEGRKI